MINKLEKIVFKYGLTPDKIDARIESIQEDINDYRIYDEDRGFLEILQETLFTLKEQFEDKEQQWTK